MRNYLLFFVFLSCFASSDEGWFSGMCRKMCSGFGSICRSGKPQDDLHQLHSMTDSGLDGFEEKSAPSRAQSRGVGQWLVDGLKSRKGKKIVCYVLVGGTIIAVTGGIGAAVGIPAAFSGGGGAALLSATGAVAAPTVSELVTATAVGGSAAVLSSMGVPQDVSPSEVPVDITPTHVLSEATSTAPEATPTSVDTTKTTAIPSRSTELPLDDILKCQPTADPVQYRAQNVTDGSQPACPSERFWSDNCAELEGEPLYAAECSTTGHRIYVSGVNKSVTCKCAQPCTGGFETMECSCRGGKTGPCEDTPLCASGCDAYYCVGHRTCYPPAVHNCGQAVRFTRLFQWFKNVVGIDVGSIVEHCVWL